MMSTSSNPLSRLRSVWRNRNEPEYAREFADVYWRTLLAAAAIVLFAAGVYAIPFFFSTLSQLGTSVPKAVIPASAINDQKLQATIAGLSGREQAFQSLEARGASAIADPSIGN